MVQSINTRADVVEKATSYLGMGSYGKILIGDKGFEFYDDRDPNNFIQIPWNEVEYVIASVLLRGRWIPRFAIQTKTMGTYSFSSKDPKGTLRSIHQYIDSKHMVRSLGFFDVIKRGVKAKFKRK